MAIFLLLALAALILLALFATPLRTALRRRTLRSQPFPAAWRDILRQRVPAPKTAEIKDSVNAMNLRTLLEEEKKLGTLFRETGSLPVAARWREVQIELKDRFAFPLMCLAVCVVGAPVGARTSRSGLSYAYAAGLLIVGGYFILRKVAEPPLLLPTLPIVLIGQIPNLLLFIWGAWMIARVDRV